MITRKVGQRNLFSNIKKYFEGATNIRMSIVAIALCLFAGILIYRVFSLQIVQGQAYLDDFQLKIEKERSIASARGNIYDRKGNLLAYNELAYSVTIEDVYESGRYKNRNINDTLFKVIKMVEKNGDSVISGYEVILNEDGEYEFAVEGTKLLRYLADIYGKIYIDTLELKERNATPDEVVEYLCSTKKYGIGTYTDPDDSKSFVPCLGYSKEDILKIITIRDAMSANSYQKYIPTTIATDISDESVAVIMENLDDLNGITIAEDTVRRYVEGKYFSQIIGYTGKASSEELEELKLVNENYAANDVIGKTGIEQAMETTLQGTKGSETVYVDNLGREIESTNYIEPIAGNDVYLTIDKDLQIAAYNIVEQNIAGIVVSKIRNVKEYNPPENASSANIIIPIYDVYFTLFDNNVISMSDLAAEDAAEYEAMVWNKFTNQQKNVLNRIYEEMYEKNTVYSRLNSEYKSYENYIVNDLLTDKGILIKDSINKEDEIYIAYSDGSISMSEYLKHAIANGWIDVSKLDVVSDYADSQEIYDKLSEYIQKTLPSQKEFSKLIFKYLIKNDAISGKMICNILWEQEIIHPSEEEMNNLNVGRISAYNFILDRIKNLEITPAQLALDPFSGSMVVTDVNTGDVLAMVSYPSYDNNRMANGVDSEYFSAILADKTTPLYNYATQQRTAPGSTYKMVSATAGLEEGIINTSSKITCRGFYETGDSIARCWIHPGAHGSLNVIGGIQHSCNAFFYEIGYELSTTDNMYDSQMGLGTLAKYADMYGLSATSGVEIEEYAPKISDADPVRSAIGQGTNNFTTAQLARYVTTVANKGTCYDLTLIDKVTDSNGHLLHDNQATVRNTMDDIKTSTWNAIQLGMKRVAEGKYYFQELGISVAGKTGTAQESKSRANHALFVCFAPYEKPEIAIATRIAFGYSSDYAAQTTKDVLAFYYGEDDDEDILTGTASEITTGAVSGD